MSYTPTSGEHFSELKETGLNTNNNGAVTASLDIHDNASIAFEIQAASGTHGTHVIMLQCSLDDSSWLNTSTTITGVGVKNNIAITTQYVRLKVTTVEGGASTVDIIIQGK